VSVAPATAPARLLTLPFLLVSIASFLQGLATHSYIHLPGFLKELGATEVQIGLIFGAMALVAILSRPMVGRAMDVRGRRGVILAGGALHVVVCAAYLTVHSLGAWIVIVRAAHGIAEAMLFSALFTYAADIVPASRRTEGIAIFGVSGLLPIAFGGLIGDFVLAHGDYSHLFLLSVAFAIAALAVSLPLREQRIELSADEPDRGFLAAALDRRLLPLWFIGTVFATCLSSIFVFLKTYVMETGIGSVGLFLAAYATAASLLRLFFGWVPDRVGPKRALFPAILVLALGQLLLARSASSLDIAVAGTLSGVGHGFAFPILAGLVVGRARASERGSAISLFTAVFHLGMLIGGPLFGAVIRYAGYSGMYLVAAGVCVVGAGVFAAWDRRV
jgi:MFS family permease